MTVFFFTYCAFEVPSNLLLKRLRPSIWLPSIMVAWGIVMTLMGIVQDFKGLLIARLFLGVTEAGLYPGVAYYITMWYCRTEAQFRQAMFFSAASVAGAFSGLLAFGIAVSIHVLSELSVTRAYSGNRKWTVWGDTKAGVGYSYSKAFSPCS